MTRRKKPADCADEPIHLAGAIQPHGWLLSCDPGDWTIRHVSANVDGLFELPAEQVVGQSLASLVDATALDALAGSLHLLEPGLAAQRVLTGNLGPTGRLCDVSVHVQQGLAHVEIEPHRLGARGAAPELTAQAMIGRIADIDEPGEFFERVARLVRELTGYDRVMVYRFRADDAGEVIAESLGSGVESYRGLRFPASDIPAQARRLYMYNRLRVIPDASYVPVPIVPNPAGAPLDLSQHVLRSVSPVHLEYLRNMGVGASMSISIIAGGRLWGLIACHHRVPRQVSATTRAVADLFGMYVSMRVAARRQETMLARVEHVDTLLAQLRTRLDAGTPVLDALREALPKAVFVLKSDGAWLSVDGAQHAIGAVPPVELLPVLRTRAAPAAAVLATSRADWVPAGRDAGGLAGTLSLPFADNGDGVHFFRAEQVEDVRWAGEPLKAMVPTDDGKRMAPRRSFREWRETVGGSSIAWDDDDRRAAERLFAMLADEWRRRSRAGAPARREPPAGGVDDQRRRLQQLSALLDGIENLDPAQGRLLARRIASLEVQLRDLVGDADTKPG